MKYIIAFLLLCASTVFGAVPSFQAFDANFFQITGTGNNSIKIKTNNFTWGAISGGSGDSVWTNSGGVIQPVSTNAIKIYERGALGIGLGTEGFFGPLDGNYTLVSVHDTTAGDSPVNQLYIYSYNGNDDNYVQLFTSTNYTVVEQASFKGGGTDSIKSETGIGGSGSLARTRMKVNGTDRVDIFPSAADGTTPYTFDTSVAHTSGNVFAFKNFGTNAVFADWVGNLNIGRNVADAGSSPNYQLIASRSTTKGETARSGIYLSSLDSENFEYYSTFDLRLLAHKDTPTGVLDMTTWATNGLWGEIIITTSLGSEGIEMYASGVSRLKMIPSVADGATPYVMDTDKAHSSGNLLEVKNNGTNKFAVAWDGTVNIDQANIGSATFTNVYFLNPIIGSNGVASYAANAPVAITASGWTNSYSVNAIAEIDSAAADLKYFIKNSAGTGVYTNLASSTVWHATAILQPGGAVVITAGTTPSGTARPF